MTGTYMTTTFYCNQFKDTFIAAKTNCQNVSE